MKVKAATLRVVPIGARGKFQLSRRRVNLEVPIRSAPTEISGSIHRNPGAGGGAGAKIVGVSRCSIRLFPVKQMLVLPCRHNPWWV
jgi:hypothetical protein